MDVDSTPSVPKEDRAHQPDTNSSCFGTRPPVGPGQVSHTSTPDTRIAAPVGREVPRPGRLALRLQALVILLGHPDRCSTISRHQQKPPTAPSQTLSAQELRETAKQTMGQRSLEKSDERRLLASDSHSLPGSQAPSPRHRSPSPPSRTGARNYSQESRISGGRHSERGDGVC